MEGGLPTAVERLFEPGAGARVGVELELIPSFADGSSVPPAALAATFDEHFRLAARPSFEPGGQLELSPGCRGSVAALMRDVPLLLTRAQALAECAGVSLTSVGTDPLRSCADVPLRLSTPRYCAMQDQFDRIGPDGRRMMRLTASLQVNIDLSPGRAGAEQWLVANLAGPALASAFANSPTLDGQPAGIPAARTRIWQGVDVARTAYDGRNLDADDPIGSYLDFAASAPRLPIAEAGADGYHLGTLFPPVRPRGGYLEIRYLDAQPVQRIGDAVTTIAGLLLDAEARRAALDLLLPTIGCMTWQWTAASRGDVPGTGDLLAIAAAGARRLPHGYLAEADAVR